MTREPLQEQRRRYASMDADVRRDAMMLDILSGVAKDDSATVTNAEDAALWDRIATDKTAILAWLREQAQEWHPDDVPLDEDDWGRDAEGNVVWLGEDAWRRKRKRIAGG